MSNPELIGNRASAFHADACNLREEQKSLGFDKDESRALLEIDGLLERLDYVSLKQDCSAESQFRVRQHLLEGNRKGWNSWMHLETLDDWKLRFRLMAECHNRELVKNVMADRTYGGGGFVAALRRYFTDEYNWEEVKRYVLGVRERKDFIQPTESVELAWFLGVTCGDGYVTVGTDDEGNLLHPSYEGVFPYRATLTSTSSSLAVGWGRVGMELFGLVPSYSFQFLSEKDAAWRDAHYISFNGSKEMVEYLGDMKTFEWHKTLMSNHAWVLSSDDYTWAFLAGYFDAEGFVADPLVQTTKHKLSITVSNPQAAILLLEMLQKVGCRVEFPDRMKMMEGKMRFNLRGSKRKNVSPGRFSLEYNMNRASENNPLGVRRISMVSYDQVKYFSQHVHSAVPEKERRLWLVRHSDLETMPKCVPLAYKRALLLRKRSEENGRILGAQSLMKDAYLSKYLNEIGQRGLTNNFRSLINNWLHAGNNPIRNPRRYQTVTYPSSNAVSWLGEKISSL